MVVPGLAFRASKSNEPAAMLLMELNVYVYRCQALVIVGVIQA